MQSYYENNKGILYCGDAFDIPSYVVSESVQCVVTSPPYWGLRSYFNSDEYQLGLEKTPEEYIEHLVDIFRKIRQVLHPSGTVWLVIDDTYCVPSTIRETTLGMKPGVSEKNMIGIPWRVALALQNDGWWLRCDVIWSAKNKLPEPVKDRPTRNHEYVFLLTKKAHYFYDYVEVQEKIVSSSVKCAIDRSKIAEESHDMFKGGRQEKRRLTKKNRRSVWDILVESTTDSHHTGFPEKLVDLCIKAGTSKKGCCSKCYSPIERIEKPKDPKHPYTSELVTVGWKATCNCNADVIPCTVLDLFTGRGTTLMVAEQLGRKWIGTEITKESCEIAKQNLISLHTGGVRATKKAEDGLFSVEDLNVEPL